MKKTCSRVCRNNYSLLLILLLPLISVSPIFGIDADESAPGTPVMFFYSTTCAQCKQMKQTIELIMVDNPGVRIEFHDVDGESGLWEKTCSDYGIPAWGDPRIFIGSQNFAGWFQYAGDLRYEASYNGYIGYSNQIIRALGLFFNCPVAVPETGVTASGNDSQNDDDCGC